MLRVGIVGFGGIGKMHLGVWNKTPGCEVVAVADVDPEKLKVGVSKQEINVGTAGGLLDPAKTGLYRSAAELLAKSDVEAVDICTPTCFHAELSVMALKAGRHVLCEKPMALDYAECSRVVRAQKETGLVYMTAQCIRFWPEYEYLAETIKSRRLGALKWLNLLRQGSPPRWAWKDWFAKRKMSGGGILDLHVHDVDFIVSVFGAPKSVCSQGAIGFSKGWDSVTTLYDYGPKRIVSAQCSLNLPANAGFKMTYQAVFADGMIVYDGAQQPPFAELNGKEKLVPKVPEENGYAREIGYFVDCIRSGKQPKRCLPESSALSIKVAKAEEKSCETGRPVKVS